MTEQADGQMSIFDLGSWSGKTSPELSAATKAKTSGLCSKRPQKSRIQTPLYLDLRKENGLTPDALWETDGASLGEYSTHSFWECPNVAVESHLSQILEETPHPKYSLSAKACQGILRRAEKRGKELPPILKQALLRQSAFKNEQAVTGGVKESLSSTTGQEHSQLSTTNLCYGISAFESNAMKSGNPHSGIYEAETARTLDNNGGSPACNQGGIAVVAIENHPADSRVKLSKDNCVQCLSSRMGTGGGNVPMVMSKGPNAVCIGNGQADQLKVSEKVGALNCMHDQQAVIARSIVRRLTPLECTRLQGFPDGWVDIGNWTDSKGKKHKDADSPKYKALGNSIAIPPWMYVLSRLNRFCAEHTMASLFDGIAGFPLIWETLNGRGSCIWASEIEEFPMAVTKLRFGNEA